MTGSDETGNDRLLAETTRFANELTATVRAVVGASAEPFRATGKVQAGRTGVAVRQAPRQGIVLTVERVPMLVLKVALHCVWDHRQDWLAVEDSRFEVFAKGVSEALFRYDYLRQPNSVPSAHVQVHAHRDAITTSWLDAEPVASGHAGACVTPRKAADSRSCRIFTFPSVGRFRPCLEDVLEMVIDELGVDYEDGAHEASHPVANAGVLPRLLLRFGTVPKLPRAFYAILTTT